jgi:hypothetical protein
LTEAESIPIVHVKIDNIGGEMVMPKIDGGHHGMDRSVMACPVLGRNKPMLPNGRAPGRYR